MKVALATLVFLALLFSACSTGGDGSSSAGLSASSSVSLSGLSISGDLKLKLKLKLKAPSPRQRDIQLSNPSPGGFVVVAMCSESTNLYYGTVDDAGKFALSIPDSESNKTFFVSILAPEGRSVGPVLFGTNGAAGISGVTMGKALDLGAIDVPEDPASDGITTSNSTALASLIQSNAAVRLSNGAPVGISTYGKGGASLGAASGATYQLADADGDGLIAAFDADDDGNGIIDDFEPNKSRFLDSGLPAGWQVTALERIHLSVEQMTNYISGDPGSVSNALLRDMTLEFWFNFPAKAGLLNDSGIASVTLLSNPGPVYLRGLGAGMYTIAYQPDEYARTGRPLFKSSWQPGAILYPGDTYMFRVIDSAGKTNLVTRMLNYVFNNPPLLKGYGAASNAIIAYAGTNQVGQLLGDQNAPILFDGTSDLWLSFQPPVDDTGAWITNIDHWVFEFMFGDTNGNQINSIDLANSWSDSDRNAIGGGFAGQNQNVDLSGPQMMSNYSPGLYKVKLAKEIFKDAIVMQNGATNTVRSWKVGIRSVMSDSYIVLDLVFRKSETNRPTLSLALSNVTFPGGGSMDVRGYIDDDTGPASAWASLDGVAWLKAGLNTADSPDSWSVHWNSLPSGSTNVWYYGLDQCGNSSVTNQLSVMVP